MACHTTRCTRDSAGKSNERTPAVNPRQDAIYLDQVPATRPSKQHLASLWLAHEQQISSPSPHQRLDEGRYALADSSQAGCLNYISQTYRAVYARFLPVQLYVKRPPRAPSHQSCSSRAVDQAKKGARFNRLLCCHRLSECQTASTQCTHIRSQDVTSRPVLQISLIRPTSPHLALPRLRSHSPYLVIPP